MSKFYSMPPSLLDGPAVSRPLEIHTSRGMEREQRNAERNFPGLIRFVVDGSLPPGTWLMINTRRDELPYFSSPEGWLVDRDGAPA